MVICLTFLSAYDSSRSQVAKNSPAAPLAPLVDPAKLDSLQGKRAATPRLRKACYWLEMIRRGSHDLE